VQTLALLEWLRADERCSGPHLIVTPASTLANWARECRKWAPRLRVRTYRGGADRLAQQRALMTAGPAAGEEEEEEEEEGDGEDEEAAPDESGAEGSGASGADADADAGKAKKKGERACGRGLLSGCVACARGPNALTSLCTRAPSHLRCPAPPARLCSQDCGGGSGVR